MKKFLICLICFMCIFKINSVKAIDDVNTDVEENQNVEENQPSTEEPAEEENTPNTEDPNPAEETPADISPSDENLDSNVNQDQTTQDTVQPPTTTNYTTYNTEPRRATVPKSTVSDEGNIKVEISNIDSATKEFIIGSKFQIQDENGNVLHEWESTAEAYVIDDLGEGKYYLVQIEVPDEYKLLEEKIEFLIENESLQLEISNELIKEEKKVLGSNSILLSVAMFDLALGIGIATYVKKNKTTK